MAYRVIITNNAKKSLAKIEHKQRRIILAWIKSHLEGCDNPRNIEGSKPLKGSVQGWRYRVGSYRILVTIKDDELVVEVVRVGHRQGVYNNLPKL